MRSLGLGPSAFDRYRVRGAVSGLLKPNGGSGRLVSGALSSHASLSRSLRAPLTALLVGAVLLAGCGSSDNGVSSKSGKEILAASKEAAESASAVHVVGRNSVGPSSFAINLSLAGHGGHGQISLLGLNFEVIRIGDTVYVKGSPAFYERLGAVLGTTLHVPDGTWLKGIANSGPLSQLAAFVDLRPELDRMLSTPGTVTKGVTTEVNDQKVIELKEATKLYKGSLFVATTGKPYPVLFVKAGGREKGRTTFSEWDEPVSVTVPSPVVDIGSLKG